MTVQSVPDITEAFPIPLGRASSIPTGPQPDWDVTFNGLGFNLRPSKETPYLRGTEQSRKQQIDTSDSPGEQSLSSWWTRAQDTWDMGAGINWYEPGTEPETYKRFANSQGVDVWTPGEIKLLPNMEAFESGRSTYFLQLYNQGVLGDVQVYTVFTDKLRASWNSGEGGSETIEVVNAPDFTPPVIGGDTLWVGATDGVVKWTPTGDLNTIDTIDRQFTCSGLPRVWWVKARLIVALGPELYEVAPGAASGPLAEAGNLIYTHPSADWIWTGVVETGEAILAAGYAGVTSGIFRFTIEQDEQGQPVLSGAAPVAHMPPNEQITCFAAYLSTYLVVGTNRGVRVGLTNEAGMVQYGPINIPLDEPAADVLFEDRFAYVAVTRALPDGTSGLARIDLSAPIADTGYFAWAWDISTKRTERALYVSKYENNTRFNVVLEGWEAWTVSPGWDNTYVTSGWLDTGRIRFGTSEPKAFRLARMVCDTNGGRVRLDATTPSGAEVRVIEFDDSYVTSEQVAIQIPGTTNTHQYMSFRITLTGGEPYVDDELPLVNGAAATPVVNGLAIKAVPAAARVRLYQYPLSVFDTERNRNGEVLTSGQNNAYRRLRALEEIEETGAPVTVRDNRTGETFIGQIDTVDFTDPYPPDGAESGFGGVATVVVRRL